MAYKCYLFGAEMPQTPSKLTLKINGKNTQVTLLNGNEINILKSPGLTDIALTLTLPMLTAKRRPDYYLGLFEKFKLNKKTTQFIVTRAAPNDTPLFDTNLKVSVENYTIIENAENGLDVDVEVELKQYRDYATKKVNVKNIKTQKVASVEKDREKTNAPKSKTHTVKPGDTLWAIAAKYLGSGAKYTVIYNANKDKIKNPNVIYPGQVLTIP